MNKIIYLPLPKNDLCLPLPKNNDFKKWTNLREKLRAKKERYLEGVKKYGTVSEAMQYAEIKSRTSLANYRNSDKEFEMMEKEYFSENKEIMIDLAEKQLFKQIQAGEGWAIKYFLDRQSERYKPKGQLDVRDMTALEEYREELNRLTIYVQTEAKTITGDN